VTPLVVGLGNEWRRDDAAGLEVARRVPGAVTVREPTQLLDAWEGRDAVIVVDAVRAGAAPGTTARLDALAAPLPVELFATSTHHVGVAEAVELGRTLGRLPRALAVYGIEGADFSAGKGLTPEVERAVARLAAELQSAVG
jgi:hydrogenase maturation protease